MARSLASIETVTRLVVGARPWEHDPTCHPLDWRQDVYQEIQSRPLVIGLMLDDGCVKVHPSIERVVLEVAEKLTQAGHNVIPWTPEGHQDAIDIMVRVPLVADLSIYADVATGQVLYSRRRRRH